VGSKAICGLAKLPRSHGCTAVQPDSPVIIVSNNNAAVGLLFFMCTPLVFLLWAFFLDPYVFSKETALLLS
jgi:hypothetical protein